MKKVILSSAILLASVAGAFAQTAAGNIAIGGTLGFTMSGGKTTTSAGTTDKDKSSTIDFLPNVSYFISDKLAIGLGIGYKGSSSSSADYTNDNLTENGSKVTLKTSNPAFQINPFVKYFISTGDKSAFFLRGGVDLAFGSEKSQTRVNNAAKDNDPGKTTEIGLGVMPGFLFFPADNWGVELALGGNLLGYKTKTTKYSSSNKNTDNTLELLGVNGMGVGVSVYYFIK
jgi:hypothetical protein